MCLGCVSQKNTITENTILSEQFSDADSLIIKIEYRDVLSCISDEPLQIIQINIQNDVSKVYVFNNLESRRSIGPITGNVLPVIYAFEKKAKEVNGCGGYDGRHGIQVRLIINGKEDEFRFCKDDWDGIGELIAAFDKRKTK